MSVRTILAACILTVPLAGTALAAVLGLAAAFIFFYTLGGLVDEARHADFLALLLPMPLAAIFLSWQVTRRYVLRRLRAQL